jgi:hypothetical protein
MQRLLIVSDSENAGAAAQEMKDAGYEVERCRFAEALDRLHGAEIRALVFDLSTPTNLTDLRRLLSEDGISRETPTLALLRVEHLAERLAELQVDDFAVLPLHPRELGARMRHILERRQGTDSPDVLRQGTLVLDLANYRVFVDGSLVEFTFREYQLLRSTAVGSSPEDGQFGGNWSRRWGLKSPEATRSASRWAGCPLLKYQARPLPDRRPAGGRHRRRPSVPVTTTGRDICRPSPCVYAFWRPRGDSNP